MLVIDTEATGIDPKKHSLISIGAVDFLHPERQFYVECRPWEGAEIMKEALNVNGFTLEQLRDPAVMSLSEAINEFMGWVNQSEEKTLAGHNFFFDWNFLNAAADKSNLQWKLGYRIVDLHSLCFYHHMMRGIAPPMRNSRTDITFDRVLRYVGLPEEPKPHSALTAARMATEAFSRFMHKKQLFEEFKQHAIPDYLL